MNGMEWVLESSWKSVSFVPYDMYFTSKSSAFGEQHFQSTNSDSLWL